MKSLKEHIYDFILPYLSEKGKPIETITEYKKYDMELIAEQRNLILSFINSHFNIRKGLIRIDELLCDKRYYLWNDLSSLNDLDIFEALIGLLIAVGLLEDSIIIRFDSLCRIRDAGYGTFVFRGKFLLDEKEDIELYLETLRNHVLPLYKLNINKNIYEYMKNVLPTGTFDHQIKSKLLAWINNSSLKLTDKDLSLINDFLDNNLEGFLNSIVVGFDDENGVDSLVNYLRFDPQFDYLARVNDMVSRYTEEQREDLENKKRLFLEKIKIDEDKKRKLQ